MIFTLELADSLSANEQKLIARGCVQIAALLAARITGKGMFINPGPTDLSWDFGLVDADEEQENDFNKSLPALLEGFVQSAFSEAKVTASEPSKLQLDI
jgi:hypothetical protein